MAKMMHGKLIHCKTCGHASRTWTRWSNWTHSTVYYFCDNDCLRQWINSFREDVMREVIAECQTFNPPVERSLTSAGF